MPDTNYINSRCTLGRLPITLICDNIRDPGNMGTIIRTASAVGCSKVLAMKGKIENVDEITLFLCRNIFSTKKLREFLQCQRM